MSACLSVGVTSLCADEFVCVCVCVCVCVDVGVRSCMCEFVCLGMFECVYLYGL